MTKPCSQRASDLLRTPVGALVDPRARAYWDPERQAVYRIFQFVCRRAYGRVQRHVGWGVWEQLG